MKPIILLAEHSAEDQWNFRRALNRLRAGVTVMSVNDGDALVSYLKGEGAYEDRIQYPMPTLIVIDSALPKLNGLEALRLIRKHPEWREIKIALISGSGERALWREARELGAVAALAKPVDAEQLRSVLEI